MGEGRGRPGNTGISHLAATQVNLRPPWGHMGARASTFGLAERCTRVVSQQVYLMDLQLWRSLAVGDMRASLWKGRCTVRAPSHGRMTGEGRYEAADGGVFEDGVYYPDGSDRSISYEALFDGITLKYRKPPSPA